VNLFKYQLWHLVLLVILLFGIYSICENDPSFIAGELYEIDTQVWFLLAILSPIIHQIYVLLAWRLELYYNQISKWFGDNGFKLFAVGFALLFVSRLITILLLAVSNTGTFYIRPLYSLVLAGLFLIPSIYLFYSVRKYFGINRAFGIDHFNPKQYKNEPFIKKGIFRVTSNAMYVFGFFVLYIPGIILQSKAALAVALFNHVYIWVHYYFTERPDMKTIYGEIKL